MSEISMGGDDDEDGDGTSPTFQTIGSYPIYGIYSPRLEEQ